MRKLSGSFTSRMGQIEHRTSRLEDSIEELNHSINENENIKKKPTQNGHARI